MNFETFKLTLTDETPPPSLSAILQALWYDAKGDWEKSHELAQAQNDDNGAWVHAYLHRKEGDRSNAAYWYKRAWRPFPNLSTENEWDEIVRDQLPKSTRQATGDI